MCPYKTYDLGAMKEHLTRCGLEKVERRYTCSKATCGYSTNRLANLNRHRKRHAEIDTKESDGEWAKNDPGNLSDILGDVSTDSEVDVNTSSKPNDEYVPVRKPTHPAKVYTPPPKPVLPSIPEVRTPSLKLRTGSAEISKSGNAPSKTTSSVVAKPPPKEVQIDRATSEMPPRRMASNVLPPVFALGRNDPGKVVMTNMGTQTLQPPQKKTRWTITRWTDNGKEYEEIELVEESFDAL
jgi:hypothetical protein